MWKYSNLNFKGRKNFLSILVTIFLLRELGKFYCLIFLQRKILLFSQSEKDMGAPVEGPYFEREEITWLKQSLCELKN